MKKKVCGGRPPKFREESRPITVTLPQRTLTQLESLNTDRARAIVKCVDTTVAAAWTSSKRLEVVQVSDDTGVIIVGPSNSLAKISWLRLIEIAPYRFLLAIPPGTAIESLEVALMDLIENLPLDEVSERQFLVDLRSQLSHHRRQASVSKGEILFISTKLSLCLTLLFDWLSTLEMGISVFA